MKDNFFSNITHELRTPVTLILEPLRQILQHPTAENWLSKVSLAERNSRKLLHIVNQLLDLAKLEGGAMHPLYQRGQVADLLPVLKEMAQPVVMAGDFNMVGWSHALAALRGATGTGEAGPVLGTYTGFAPWVILPIDHVMAPGGGQTQSRPGLGSDHLGLLAELALTAGAARD